MTQSAETRFCSALFKKFFITSISLKWKKFSLQQQQVTTGTPIVCAIAELNGCLTDKNQNIQENFPVQNE